MEWWSDAYAFVQDQLPAVVFCGIIFSALNLTGLIQARWQWTERIKGLHQLIDQANQRADDKDKIADTERQRADTYLEQLELVKPLYELCTKILAALPLVPDKGRKNDES